MHRNVTVEARYFFQQQSSWADVQQLAKRRALRRGHRQDFLLGGEKKSIAKEDVARLKPALRNLP